MKRAVFIFCFLFIDVSYAKFKFDDKSSIFEVGGNSSFITKKKISKVKGTIIKGLKASISGKDIDFDEGIFEDAGNKIELSGILNLEQLGEILLDGNKSFKGFKGKNNRKLKIRKKDNRLEGEPLFDEDIELEDSNTDLTIAIKGRLSRNIVLNNGMLSLEEDLTFLDDKILTGSGRVYLNGRTLRLGAQDLTWSAPIIFYDAQDIELNSNVTLAETWTFSGSSTLNGNGNILFLDPAGNIVIEPDSTLLIKDITVRNISENNIRCLDDTSSLLLQNVNWIQDGNYSFTTGSIKFRNNVELMGTSTFSYESEQTCTIDFQTHVGFKNGMTFKMGRKEADGNEPLYAEDVSSFLSFENASLIVTASGAKVTSGTFTFHDDVNVEVNSTWTGNGLIVGDSLTPADGMKLHFYPGSNVTFHSGHFAYSMPYSNGLVSRSTSAKLVRKAASVFDLQQDVVLPELSMDVSALSQFMLGTGVDLTYENTRFILPDTEFDVTGTRVNAITTRLAGDDTIFMVRGVMPFVTYISGQGNKIHGTGSVSGPTFLFTGDDVLDVDVDGNFSGNIFLNGSLLNVLGSLHFIKDAQVTGQGTVNLAKNKIDLGTQDTTATSTLLWDGNVGKIVLNSKLSLSSTWTFSGSCILDGNGNDFDLLSSGVLVVERGSTLRLRNINVNSVCADSIYCLDDAGTIILDNMKFMQTEAYTFSVGLLQFVNQVNVSEPYSFIYKSSQISTIASGASLRFAKGSTLSYDPPVASHGLIAMADSTSRLRLNGGTLHSTTTGLRLTNGVLEVKNVAYIASDATVQTEGIYFGDGVLSANNLIIDVFPGAHLKLSSGYIIDDSVS